MNSFAVEEKSCYLLVHIKLLLKMCSALIDKFPTKDDSKERIYKEIKEEERFRSVVIQNLPEKTDVLAFSLNSIRLPADQQSPRCL